MAKIQRKYVKVGVPLADTAVLEWMAAQDNMSDSIRQLIRQDIEKNGYGDIFCREIVPGAKRGRPSNAELAMREQANIQTQVETVRETPQVVETPVYVEQTSVASVMQTVPSRVEPTKVVQPVPEPVKQNVSVDEDDFIDPEELLGLK